MGDISERIKSYSLSRNSETSVETNYKYIHYGDIHKNILGIIDSESNLPNIEIGEYNFLTKGDLILADASEDHQGIAMPAIIDFTPCSNIVAGLHTIALRPNTDINSMFLYYLIKAPTFRHFGYRMGTGMKVFGISVTNLLKFEGSLPILEEQGRIGNLLKKIDKTITLHQRKLDKLKDLKEVYLQNLLPEKNNRVPNIRFAGFCKEWEKRKLEEIAKITMGQAPKSENYTDKANDYILVQGNADLRDGKVVPRVWTTQITKKAEVGDILISVRAPVGEVGITGFPIVLGRGVASLKGNSFIYQTLKRMKNRNYWKKYSTGSTFESINSKDLKNATIYVPSKKEQSNIGNFCSKLDLMIGLHQEKSDKLNNIKNVYLQKLFV